MIHFVPLVASTNAQLSAQIAAGQTPAEGDWLVADRQSAGRGRRGREWADGLGNFMGSTVVLPHAADPPLSSLALVAGLSVHTVVSRYLPAPQRVELKWPNDLLVGGAKLSGVLLERVKDAVIVGIGVNLASAPSLPDRATTALAQFGRPPDRDRFAYDLAAAFKAWLALWRVDGLPALLGEWLGAAHPVGTPLLAGDPGEPVISGSFAGLAPDGALLLRLPDGTTRTIHAGDVNLGSSAVGQPLQSGPQ